MGRGLSPLQQQILLLAWERDQATPAHKRVGKFADTGCLYRQEILVRLWHWPITSGHPLYGLYRSGHCRHFKPSVIGERAYQAAVVSLSRAVTRLCARGLLEKQGWGLALTEQGRAHVQQLMVKTNMTMHRDINH
jgi:hypothetical protein